MELKDFIKAAITDITEAVSELQAELGNGTIVNPTLYEGEKGKFLLIDNEGKAIERLNFDVAVTISDSSGTLTGAKAGISILGAEINSASCGKTENVSRLTFSIPLVLPTAHVRTPMEANKEKHRRTLDRLRRQESTPRTGAIQASCDGQYHSDT